MNSLEVFGIKNEKAYLESLFQNNLKEIINNQLVSVNQSNIIKLNTKDFLYISKESLGKGTYGQVVNGYIFNKLKDYDTDDYKQVVAVKIPNNDKKNLYNLLIENTIHGILSNSIETQKYLPKLIQIYYEPRGNGIITIMEKMDGTINDVFKLYRKEGKHKIYDKFVLSYILQISYALYKINESGFIFSHRDLKPNNTGYKLVRAGNDKYNIDNSDFYYPNFGYHHKIIDFGMSCMEYNKENITRDSFKNYPCKSTSRDLTNFIFVFLNFNYSILSKEIIGYLGHLIDITKECNLWRDISNTTYSIDDNNDDDLNYHCKNIDRIDKHLKYYLNHPDFYNKKTEPESIIKDISQDILPYSSNAVDFYSKIK